jgi:hypothetical protein
MSFWTPPNGANPHSYSFSSPLGNLRKPPVNNNPISQVKARPVKATVQGIQQAKQASTGLADFRKPDFTPEQLAASTLPMGDLSNLSNSSPADRALGQELVDNYGHIAPEKYRGRTISSGIAAGKQKFPTSPAPHVVTLPELADIFPEKYPLSPKAGPPPQASSQSPADFSGWGALGGAGLGGALGYMMGGSDDEEKGTDNSTSRMLGTLGGAGLGGGLGYLAGNPEMRSAIMNAMKEVTGSDRVTRQGRTKLAFDLYEFASKINEAIGPGLKDEAQGLLQKIDSPFFPVPQYFLPQPPDIYRGYDMQPDVFDPRGQERHRRWIASQNYDMQGDRAYHKQVHVGDNKRYMMQGDAYRHDNPVHPAVREMKAKRRMEAKPDIQGPASPKVQPRATDLPKSPLPSTPPSPSRPPGYRRTFDQKLPSVVGAGSAGSASPVSQLAKSASVDPSNVKQAILGLMTKKARCWKGYEPVPGKKPYSDDSCRPVGSKKKKPEGKTEKKAADQFRKAITVVLAKKLVG